MYDQCGVWRAYVDLLGVVYGGVFWKRGRQVRSRVLAGEKRGENGLGGGFLAKAIAVGFGWLVKA